MAEITARKSLSGRNVFTMEIKIEKTKTPKAKPVDETKLGFGSLPGFSKVGTVADISYIKEQAENAIVIPKYLVKTLSGKNYVQVYKDGVKKETDVETGISNATEIQIVSGLSEGDEVVVK